MTKKEKNKSTNNPQNNTENCRSGNTNPTKNRGYAVPAPLVAPVLL